MKKTKIALVQMKSLVGQRENNLKRIGFYTKKAGERQADIICFPEAAVDGYSKENSNSDGITNQDIYTRVKKMAAAYSITILVGFIEKSFADKPYISHLVATPQGNIGCYRKTHLGVEEGKYFSPGENLPIFKTPKANIGIQICWETHFPEISRVMALKGADILFMPFASPLKAAYRKENWLKYLPARAYDNTVFVAACNLVGPNGKGTTYGGGLLTLDPKGNLMGEDFSGKEGILFTELDPKLLNDIRDGDKAGMKSRYYLDGRRPELYGEI